MATEPKNLTWAQQAGANRWGNVAGRADTRAKRRQGWGEQATAAGRDRIGNMWGNLSGMATGTGDRAREWQTWNAEGRVGPNPATQRRHDQGLEHDYDRYKDDFYRDTGRYNDQLQGAADNFAYGTGRRMEGRDEEFRQHGPLGERYGQRELDYLDRTGEMSGKDYAEEYGGNTLNFTQNMMDIVNRNQSGVGRDADAMMQSAMSGNLTGSQNEWLRNQMAARQPYVDDVLRQTKEAAGAQRGIGGGRLNKQLGDTSNKMYGDIMAQLSDQQSQMAQQAIGSADTRRAQDVGLAGTGAGMQANVAGAQLDAAGQQSTHMRGAAGIRNQNDQLSQQMESDIFNAMRGATNDQQAAMMEFANLSQRDKQMMLDEPDKLEKFMENLGVGVGWLKDNKDMIANVLKLIL